jgi:hypothetical protein
VRRCPARLPGLGDGLGGAEPGQVADPAPCDGDPFEQATFTIQEGRVAWDRSE